MKDTNEGRFSGELVDRWCVKHQDGWCLVRGGKKPAANADQVPTLCEYVVILPGGVEKRDPTCAECLLARG
jgi:hypothetical protein